MKLERFIILLSLITGCGKSDIKSDDSKLSRNNCNKSWTEYDEYGPAKNYERFWHAGLDSCITEARGLTNWQKSLRSRNLKEIKCTPQEISNLHLKSSGNYYSYRNNRVYIELNSSLGKFRRISIGESLDGKRTFSRDEGCFFYREDIEEEYVNPQEHGKQILLDLEEAASSSTLHPMEIYKITAENVSNIDLYRFDDNSLVDWSWCPIWTPEGFCNEMRNGNIYYYPKITDNTLKEKLKAEAILIRSEYNFEKITHEEFQHIWEYNISNSLETSTNSNWKYGVSPIPDVPFYIHRAWRDYLRNERTTMPDVESITTPQICYTTAKRVTFNDGTRGFVKGEACYVDGDYVFTQF